MKTKVRLNTLRLPFNECGLTLVELIVVFAVLMVLTTMAFPAYKDMTQTAKLGRVKADIRVLEKAITAYAIDNNRLPETMNDVGQQANIVDAWQHPYQYYNIVEGTGSPGPQYTDYTDDNLNDGEFAFDLYSFGEDGTTHDDHKIPDPTDDRTACSDDIIRIRNGNAVELASEY